MKSELSVRTWQDGDTDTLNDWLSKDAAAHRSFGGVVSEEILDGMLPVRGAVLNGGPEPVGFIGMYRIGDFATVQIVAHPSKRTHDPWMANKIAQAGEDYARSQGVKVLIASPAVDNAHSRALLRWRKYSPLPVLLFNTKTGASPVIVMGKVL